MTIRLVSFSVSFWRTTLISVGQNASLVQSLVGTEFQCSQKNRKHSETKTRITLAFRLTLNREIRQKENETET